MKKAPKEIFVMRVNTGTKDEFFSVNEKLADIECQNQRVRVAVYRLVREVEVCAEPTIICEVG